MVWSLLVLLASIGTYDDLEGRTVSEIRIEGLAHTKEHIVLRELASRVGEPYSPQNLTKDRERLDRLRVFSSIRVGAFANDATVVIEIEVAETLAYLPTLSMQVSDENGLSIGPGVRSLNFLGRGIELGASAQFGGSTNLEASISDPWFAGNHVSYQAQYFRRERTNELDDFEEIAHEPSLRLGSFIGEKGRLGVLASLSSIESDRDGVTLSPENQDWVVGAGFYLGYDSRDLWSRPTRGWWNEFQVNKSNVLDTPGDYWTYVFDVRRYDTWREKHTVLLSSLTTLQTGTLGVDIPLYSDFHLGGTNTIRGWALDSRSGKNQFINTAEYRFMLMEPRALAVSFFTAYIGLQAAAFADFGHAWNEPREFGVSEFIAGYGVGLRLLIPFVDQVRLDVAFGEPGEGATFHFGVYPKAVMQRLRVR